MSLQLSPIERRALKARAHALEPTVLVGNGGLTPAVSAEVERSLSAHELIKVRVLDGRDAREDILRRLCDDLEAVPVQHIGKILVIYRPRPAAPPKPKPHARKKKIPRMLKRNFQNRA